MKIRMNKQDFIKWLNRHAQRDHENPWGSYESAKGAVKRLLCNTSDGFDWKMYDYYQPMIVDWSGVFDGNLQNSGK